MSVRQPIPIELIGEKGFSAWVKAEDWPMIGVRCEVRRRVPQQSWPGVVVGLLPSIRCKAEWTQKSGKAKSMLLYHEATKGRPLGHTYDVTNGQHTWQATITERGPATLVRIRYEIQAGPKTRIFFADGDIPGYGERVGDKVLVRSFTSWPT